MKPALIATTAAFAVIAGLGVTYVMTSGSDDKYAHCRTGSVAGGAIGGPFTLVDQEGATVTDQDVFDEPSLLYFGYTFCPDACPFDMARNADAVDLLAERGAMSKPVFVTIDPERDTPEALAVYAEYLHPKLTALSGTAEQVKAASLAYRTYYKKQPSEDPDLYLVDHSTFTYLVMPEDGFVEFFRRDMSAEQMADAVQCFIDAG